MDSSSKSSFGAGSTAVVALLLACACGDDEDGSRADADASRAMPDAGRDAARPPREDAATSTDAGVDAGAGDAAVDVDSAPPPSPADIPEHLEGTGLYAAELGGALASGVREYEPLYPQWVDGATKRRFLLLPDSEVIDTSDMDDWDFPIGTKVWEELSRGGRLSETRYIYRYGPEDEHWTMVAYRWQGGRATAVPDGAAADAGADDYIPPTRECRDCHESRGSRLLGLSAIQLSHDRGDVNLAALEGAGLLSDPPPGNFALPGDADERAALGYLHSNCGCCHNPTGDPFTDEGVEMEHWQRVGQLATVEGTVSYTTSVGVESVTMPGKTLVLAGDASASLLVDLMSSRGKEGMPPVGSVLVDDTGLALLRSFVDGLGGGDDAGTP